MAMAAGSGATSELSELNVTVAGSMSTKFGSNTLVAGYAVKVTGNEPKDRRPRRQRATAEPHRIAALPHSAPKKVPSTSLAAIDWPGPETLIVAPTGSWEKCTAYWCLSSQW